jgi:hypothetical protein
MRRRRRVVVYAFSVRSAEDASYVAASYKATLETITRLNGIPFEETAESVPAWRLDADGRYDPGDDGWKSSSFDLQQGLDVQEVDGNPEEWPAPRPRDEDSGE